MIFMEHGFLVKPGGVKVAGYFHGLAKFLQCLTPQAILRAFPLPQSSAGKLGHQHITHKFIA